MHVSLLGASARQRGLFRKAAKSQPHAEEVLQQMQAAVPEKCSEYVEFEAALRHFVSRHLCAEKPGDTLLGVISADTGDGRSTVAIALARALADVYHSVVLVEIAEDEGIREQLHLPPRPGLRDFLNGTTGVDEVVLETASKKLWLVPAGLQQETGNTLDRVQRTGDFLETLRKRFDVVVIDMPPVLRNEQAPALVRCLDSAVLVTSAGSTHMEDVAETVRLCGDVQIRGVLLNRFRGVPGWISSLIEP